MRNPVPPIREDKAARKERLRREHDGHRKPRVPICYLLVTQQAQDRQDVARLLGIHRHTIGRWLARYVAGGLDTLLATHVPTGTPVSLAPAVLASLENALHRPEGVASSEALRQWVRQTHGVGARTQRSTPWCACASRPSSEWPDRATHKNPEAIPAFPAACGERLQEVIPPANTHPVRVFSRDDSRVGLLTIRRRRLTARGVQPVGSVQHVFEWGYFSGAVEPTTGAQFFPELPYLNAELLQADDAAALHALTGYTYLVGAIHALASWRSHIRSLPS